MFDLKMWDNFFIIIGSASGALIGLQFVVLTLIADTPTMRSPEGGRAFATPTIVHFSIALLLSALCSMPWQTLNFFSILCLIISLCGVMYVIKVAYHILTQKIYKPVLEDYLFHLFLPLLMYGILLLSAFTLANFPNETFYLIGATTLMLVLIGIHNAWDAISYHVFIQKQ